MARRNVRAVMFPRFLPSRAITCTHPRNWGSITFKPTGRPPRCIEPRLSKGLFSHMKGGFFHDGRFPDLRSVVDHYDSNLKTGLSDGEKADLIAYLMTL